MESEIRGLGREGRGQMGKERKGERAEIRG